MAKLNLTDLSSLANQTTAIQQINANSALIETALENTLSLDGTTPNAMNTHLDMNGYTIINAGEITEDGSGNVNIGGDLTVNGDLTVSGDFSNINSETLTITSTDASSSLAPNLILYRNSASPAALDNGGNILFNGEDSAGNTHSYAGISSLFEVVSNGTEAGRLLFKASSGGTLTSFLGLTAGVLFPATNDGTSLGNSSLSFSDLFLASGGVVNFNASDVTITHSANTLAFAGASTGYTFATGPLQPSANDGVALGTSTVSFSDLFLASGGVVNFNNGNYTVTHSAGLLTTNGALTVGGNVSSTGSIRSTSATAGVGYNTGAGGAVTQITSRITGVTLNTASGAITMFTAAGSATAATFTVTNSAVAITDTIVLNQRSGTNLYNFIVTAVAAGSFNITFFTTGGTASDAPVINFNVIKGVNA